MSSWDWDWWKSENPREEFEKGTYDIEDMASEVMRFVKVDIFRNMNTKQMPCENQNYDQEYTTFLIKKLLSVAGCVVPWVKRDETVKICMDQVNATIAEND